MTPYVRLALVVHNHQPIGNFDHVVERSYAGAYLPLLETFARYPQLRMALHLSGPLFDWLEERHPEYLDRVAALAKHGRIQILGGAYYEPILPMIPRRDRHAQLARYAERLARKFGARPTGAWLPERVWEQQLASDLAAAGVEHTIVDDFHFRNAGLKAEQLHGYFLTEDDGRLLAVFPGSERLRYAMPFAPPEESIDYLRRIAHEQPGAVVTFADDGEKFGAWPGTREHCYDRGWLTRFFDLLAANSWIETTVPADVVRDVAPLGKVYLPDGSYREMAEWSSLEGGAASDRRQPAGDSPDALHRPADAGRSRGNWRNFLVKYPEAGEMYARMMMVSDRVARAEQMGYPDAIVAAAQDELHKAQCNCAYWHGSFAGVYLRHLRQAVYRHLIRADDILDRTADRPEHWVEAVVRDHNLDVRPEVCLASDRLIAFVAPHHGGRLYELDVRGAAQNVLATVAGRPEPYHGAADHALAYDPRPRHALIEHFYADRPTLDDVVAGRAVDVGDFADGAFQFRVEHRDDVACLRLRRTGRVADLVVTLTKTISLSAGGDALTCEYLLENLPIDREFRFGVELNFAGFDDGDGRELQQFDRRPLGRSGLPLELTNLRGLRLTDAAAGLDIGLGVSQSASWFSYPVRVVNRCETGLETTHQAVCLVPHWPVRGDAEGRWSVTLSLPIETFATNVVGRPDLGDVEPQLSYPQVELVTEAETVRVKPAVRRKTTRRLKAAG